MRLTAGQVSEKLKASRSGTPSFAPLVPTGGALVCGAAKPSDHDCGTVMVKIVHMMARGRRQIAPCPYWVPILAPD